MKLIQGPCGWIVSALVLLVFLVAQLVTKPPAMQETLVQFLGQEYPLEKG